jgi:asparagine N-glycosylation enzyme membrane subunit Stt3
MEFGAKKVNVDPILEERKRRVKEFFSKRPEIIYLLILAVIIFIGAIYIRTAPIPYLKDVTTGNYTLGPDLDPFLFLRLAKTIVANGSLPAMDYMRYVPLGFNNQQENYFLQYTIAYLYKFLHLFDPSVTIEYAAIIYPVIAMILTMIFFFLFVRKAFSNQGKHQSNIIALIATAFLGFIPAFLHRSVAGIAEKEPAGMLFMFAAFYFFILAWKSENIKKSIFYGVLSGISTWLMGMFWGGVVYIFVITAMAALISFLCKSSKKNFLIYTSWLITFTILLGLLIGKYGGIRGLLLSTTSGVAFFVFGVMLTDIILFKTKIKDKINARFSNIPHQFISLISLIVLGFLIIIIFSPSMIGHIYSDAKAAIIQTSASRLIATVAENNQPFFDSWKGSFGLGFFWIFIIGSMFIFYEAVKNFKHKWLMTLGYVLMILGIIFSKYSSTSIMNGTGNLSILFYIGSAIFFVIVCLLGYMREYKEKKEFNIDPCLVFVLSIFFFSALEARAAIRLFHVLIPAASMTAAFLIVKLPELAFKKREDEIMKIILWIAAAAVIILAAYSLYSFEQSCYSQALNERPSSYTVQWQEAMGWVRDNTPKDAVFAHWWDYGYWVQTMGERATVLDGGNAIDYWDYLMGRHVLTGQNETEALEFLKTHNATHLLIDSTDIGKYQAYSSIGGDENYDRFSWMPTFMLDDRQTRETRNETVYVYTGGMPLDEDLVWKNQIYPSGKAGIGAVVININKEENSITQPKSIMIYQGKQIEIPLKCVYLNNKLLEFKEGFGCLYIIPRIDANGVNNMGAGLYISDKSMNALWVKLYLLNQTEGNFELVHSEDSAIIKELRSKYNMTVGDFIQYGDIQGPIKIWKINYPEDIRINPDYLLLDYPNTKLREVTK